MADLSYVKDLEHGLQELRHALKIKVSRTERHLLALKLANRMAGTLFGAVAEKSRSVGGISLNRELTFLYQGIAGLRSGLKDKEVGWREANRELKELRRTITRLLGLLHDARHRAEIDAANLKPVEDTPPWEDYNPRLTTDLKFDQFRKKLAEAESKVEQRSAEVKQQILEDSKPLQDTGGMLPEQAEIALDHLSDLTQTYDAEYLPKLPRKLRAAQAFRLPMVVYTEKTVSRTRLDKARIKYHELYPGYIFERQLLLAVPKDLPLSEQETMLRDFIASKGINYVEPLAGTEHSIITTPWAPRVVFFWLMPSDTYRLLETPRVLQAQLAFSQKSQVALTTDLSKLSRDMLLGQLSERYDPDNFDGKLHALDPDSRQKFRVTKLPIMVEPQVQYRMDVPELSFPVVKVNDRQYILENQLVLVVRKEDYTSALFHTEKFQTKVAQYLATKHRKKLPVVNPLNGMAITTPLNDECVYVWLMSDSDYNRLRQPKFVRFGFPFAGGAFSTSDALVNAKRKRFARQLNKLERKLHKEHPRDFRVLTAFREKVKEADRELLILDKQIDRMGRDLKNEKARIEQLPLTTPDRHVYFTGLELAARRLLRLETEQKELRDQRKVFQSIVNQFEGALEKERTQLKAVMLKSLRA